MSIIDIAVSGKPGHTAYTMISKPGYMPYTRVLLIDDQPLFVKGLFGLINGLPLYTIVGEARTSAEAMNLLYAQKPGLAVMELAVGDEDGFRLIKMMKSHDPNIAILVLSAYDERYYAERVLRSGARGYIMKRESESAILEAIKSVMSGKIYLSDAERERLFEYMAEKSRKNETDWFASIRKLSDRQFQVFSLLAQGLGTLEIAARLNLSPKTIDTHKEYLKLRLHCRSSQELKQLAIGWMKFPNPPPHPI